MCRAINAAKVASNPIAIAAVFTGVGARLYRVSMVAGEAQTGWGGSGQVGEDADHHLGAGEVVAPALTLQRRARIVTVPALGEPTNSAVTLSA